MSEITFAACLIFSIVAVITPLMFLWSVKVGFVDRLKEDFINDPRYRVIRPDNASVKQAELLDRIKQVDGVSFLQPMVAFTPRGIDIGFKADGRRVTSEARLIATSLDDPIHERLAEGTAPSGDQVVVSQDLAKRKGLQVGDELILLIGRIVNDRRERVRLKLSVTGVMSAESSNITTVWVPLEIERAVENFRSGIAVPRRGWAGISGQPKRSYEAALILTPEPIGERRRTELRIRFGANEINQLDLKKTLEQICGTACAARSETEFNKVIHIVRRPKGLYSSVDIAEGKDILGGIGGTTEGLIGRMKAHVTQGDRGDLGMVDVVSLPKSLEPVFSIELERGKVFAATNQIALPKDRQRDFASNGESTLFVEFEVPKITGQPAKIKLPLRPVFYDAPSDAPALISSDLAGMINRAQQVALEFDQQNLSFIERSIGFRGFRAIAQTFEAVPEIAEKLEAMGVSVRARTDDIVRLQKLERSLNVLVLIVGVVAAIGAISILSSSFFANVQRKIVQFACLRLLGFDKTAVSLIPLFQAILIGVYGFVASVIAFLIISAIVNGYIASAIGFDATLSKLGLDHFMVFFGFVIFCSTFSASFASRLATKADPARALK
ncbi:MAG: ABC transporter permease [Pseudomonadota bacterium]